jgi:hypothetical protein
MLTLAMPQSLPAADREPLGVFQPLGENGGVPGTPLWIAMASSSVLNVRT